jgi:hypothetical protein
MGGFRYPLKRFAAQYKASSENYYLWIETLGAGYILNDWLGCIFLLYSELAHYSRSS